MSISIALHTKCYTNLMNFQQAGVAALTLPTKYVIVCLFLMWNITREHKDPGTWLKALHKYPLEGGLMKPMKKPIRLLGMVFQIDHQGPWTRALRPPERL